MKIIRIIIFSLLLFNGCNINRVAEGKSGKATWKPYGGNPVIKVGQKIPNMIWNDPSLSKKVIYIECGYQVVPASGSIM